MELLEKAQALEAQGKNIVHMEIGEPDFATPAIVKEAAIKAIEEGPHLLYPQPGPKELRERIAAHYAETRGVHISPERIIVTNGTSGAFFLLCSVLLDRTKNFVISDPGYPCYRNFGVLFDARVISLPVSETSRFEITPEQLDETGVTPHLLMVCSPSNPTGTEYRSGIDREASRLSPCKGRADGRRRNIFGPQLRRQMDLRLDLSDDIVVVDGFSKTYAMTGWRLGWIVVPQSLLRPMQKVAQNVFISAPTIAQYAAIHAFDASDELETMKRTYMERRDYLFPRLQELGFGLPGPAGWSLLHLREHRKMGHGQHGIHRKGADGGRCGHHARLRFRHLPGRLPRTLFLCERSGKPADGLPEARRMAQGPLTDRDVVQVERVLKTHYHVIDKAPIEPLPHIFSNVDAPGL